MADSISWVATVATIIAASMTAANLGSRITGYGFCVFLVGSISWLAAGVLTDQPALTWTNILLSFLNLFGIWRWLGRQTKVEEGGLPKGTIIEFSKDGKVTVTAKMGDKDATFGGTYEVKGDNPVKDSSKRYQNHYIFFAHFRDGKIARWVEYSNPKIYEAATAP